MILHFLLKLLNWYRRLSGLAEPDLVACSKCGNVDFAYNMMWNWVDKYYCEK